MTIALIIAIVNAFAALVAYVTKHTIMCGFRNGLKKKSDGK